MTSAYLGAFRAGLKLWEKSHIEAFAIDPARAEPVLTAIAATIDAIRDGNWNDADHIHFPKPRLGYFENRPSEYNKRRFKHTVEFYSKELKMMFAERGQMRDYAFQIVGALYSSIIASMVDHEDAD